MGSANDTQYNTATPMSRALRVCRASWHCFV